ncbi:hypothetical protein AQUCO_01900004v1 [Aquilegia coerulea]|uniref:RING-type E3 ubiquitin transferase n=1 Tax=Aquilegia coerulea TaxID=218851 RepID=A0A2G5DIP0_AQUCA|nr:hypothetical protein AQUCO_01900004v1 [Aquilegia coerulea]PIA43333.1 hypothetical protein AQUCO_01900004v1 [Aquilegia coerulea]
MGSVCGCLHVDDIEEYANPDNPAYQNCICIRCLLQNCITVYTTLFHRGEVHAIPSSVEGETSLTSTASQDINLSDTYSSPPRPLPYDADPRCYRSQRGGLVSRHEKGSSHSHEESEPLRGSDCNAVFETYSSVEKCYGSAEGGSKECFSDPPLKHPSAKLASGIGYFYTSSEEEDVCPTCLEEYTPENPKIMTRCAHHYHLGCIYEWMERSDSCPVCGKVMEFDETT